MTLGISGFKSKKAIKEAIGQDISDHIVETSLFGAEYKPTGKFVVVGPDAYRDRRYFAEITVENHILKGVK